MAWILRTQRMAFPPRRGPSLGQLQVGDNFLLMTTRGCYHSPDRDRTRVIGAATMSSPIALLDEPITIVGREFPLACDLEIASLAPFREGVEISLLVDQLEVFPHKHAWSAALRRPVVPLPDADAMLLSSKLAQIAEPAETHRDTYLEGIKPIRRWFRPGSGREPRR